MKDSRRLWRLLATMTTIEDEVDDDDKYDNNEEAKAKKREAEVDFN